jgi:hypothetical protein
LAALVCEHVDLRAFKNGSRQWFSKPCASVEVDVIACVQRGGDGRVPVDHERAVVASIT